MRDMVCSSVIGVEVVNESWSLRPYRCVPTRYKLDRVLYVGFSKSVRKAVVALRSAGMEWHSASVLEKVTRESCAVVGGLEDGES